MQQSKLIQFLRLFTPDELKRFERFLLSPYFNSGDKMVKFLKLLAPHHPTFDSPKLEKEKVYRALHGKGVYNDQTMRDLIADAFKLAKTFSAIEQLQHDELQASDLRYIWLENRNPGKLLEAEVETSARLLEKRTSHDDYFYRYQWLYETHKFQATAARYLGAEHKLSEQEMTAPAHALNRYYLMHFFQVNLFHLAASKIYNHNVNEQLLKHIEGLASDYINLGDTSIDIYYNSFQLVRTDDDKYFYELKTKFLAADETLSKSALIEAGITLENYCIKKIRLGVGSFSRDVLDIFKFEAEQGLCFNKNGEVDPVFYQNVAGMGSESRLLDWVEEFVERNKSNLLEQYREEVYNYARAHVLFARKRYDEALRLALGFSTTFFFWNRILINNLVARSHYELKMFPELFTDLETYKHHLRDEKVSELRRQHTQAFVNSIRHLAELNLSFSKERFNAISKQINDEKMLTSKQWFLDKLEVLGNNKRKN